MRISTIILFLLMEIAVPVFISGQEIYDLKKCIATGLENNYSILIAGNLEDVAASNATPGNAGLLPSIDLTSRYGGTVNSTFQNLSDGSADNTYGEHNRNASAGVSVNWTIFEGYNARITLRKLNELKALGELNTQIAIETLVSGIAAEYYFYMQQKQLYKNLEFAVELSKERVRIDEERYLLGAGSKLQLLQSEVYLNSDSSRLAKQNEVLRSSEIRLNKLMAVPKLEQSPVIIDSVFDISKELDYDVLTESVYNNNSSLLKALSNKKITEYDYRIIASRSYPYVIASTGYNYNFNKYEMSPVSSQHTTGMNYGLTVGIDIFDGFNRRREKQNALIGIKNDSLQYLLTEQEIIGDLITLYSAYTNNLFLMDLEEQNLSTASENLDIAFERYKLGNLSGIELREVQKSYLDAKESLLSVQYQVKSAEISLMLISGQIMSYYNHIN